MKIAGVYRIIVELSERLNAHTLFALARSLVRLLALPCLAVATYFDAGEELGRRDRPKLASRMPIHLVPFAVHYS